MTIKKVRLKDIAEELNISVNTVSCALKGSNGISQETIEKVTETARRMGYIPNAVASSMRTGVTHTVAIILGDIANAYFAIMVKALEKSLREYGYVMSIFVTNENEQDEYNAIYTALANNVDGIILFPCGHSDSGIQLIKAAKKPFILIGRHLADETMDYIISDDVQGGYLATKHFLMQGHRDILILTGPEYISCARERLKGYLKAHEEMGVPVKKQNIVSCEVKIEEKKNALFLNVLGRTDYTAMITYNDIIAYRLLRIAKKQGIQPKPIIGYDNVQSQIDFGFDISTINIYKNKMAGRAVKILIQRIRDEIPAGKYIHEIVPVKLIER